MTAEIKFRRLMRSLLARGIKPTPTVINRYLDRAHRASINSINGREARWRREEFLAAGWLEPIQYIDPRHNNIEYIGHWSPPR